MSYLRFFPLSRFLRSATLVAMIVACAAPAIAQRAAGDRARLEGRVVDAITGEALSGATVEVESPALVGSENMRMRTRTNEEGRYQLNVPPGPYQIWARQVNFSESDGLGFSLAAGENRTVDFELQPMRMSKAYRVETIPLPPQMIPELSGVDFSSSGKLVAVNRRGEAWIADDLEAGQWRRFAYGMYEPFGVVAVSDDEIYVIQRPEITRLRDTNGDGRADVYETVSDDWGITGNYHEFSYGLARDSKGNLYGGLGMVSAGEFPWTRGELRPERVVPWTGPGRVPDGHRSVVPFQAWTFKVKPDGTFVPLATGFRQPLGIGVSPDDEFFISDVAGAWVPTSVLIHVEEGKFYGHPDGLKWHPDFQDRPVTPELLADMRVPPSIFLPRGPMGTSPGQPVWDTTGGKFGPFSGQLFIGDLTSLFMRVDLEKVAGAFQGAAFPFLQDQGLRIGSMHHAFGPDGQLYLAQTVRGWTVGEEGLQRIVWNGENPVEIHSMRLTERGFRLTFTETMDHRSASNPENYRITRFQYNYHMLDGSLRVNEVRVPVTEAKVMDDGRAVELTLLELLPTYIYELQVDNVRSAQGEELENPSAFYTLNRLLSGETRVTHSVLAAESVVDDGIADPIEGANTYRLYCAVCHQVDGRGSAAVGTPDMTGADGPLSMSDEDLFRIISEGGTNMPPFGNVLPPRDIRNVVAHLREAFGSGR